MSDLVIKPCQHRIIKLWIIKPVLSVHQLDSMSVFIMLNRVNAAQICFGAVSYCSYYLLVNYPRASGSAPVGSER